MERNQNAQGGIQHVLMRLLRLGNSTDVAAPSGEFLAKQRGGLQRSGFCHTGPVFRAKGFSAIRVISSVVYLKYAYKGGRLWKG